MFVKMHHAIADGIAGVATSAGTLNACRGDSSTVSAP
jgi:hypothetical protein